MLSLSDCQSNNLKIRKRNLRNNSQRKRQRDWHNVKQKRRQRRTNALQIKVIWLITMNRASCIKARAIMYCSVSHSTPDALMLVEKQIFRSSTTYCKTIITRCIRNVNTTTTLEQCRVRKNPAKANISMLQRQEAPSCRVLATLLVTTAILRLERNSSQRRCHRTRQG